MVCDIYFKYLKYKYNIYTNIYLYRFNGKFSVTIYPSANNTTKFTSNSTLKCKVSTVGQVNNLGNTMYIGITKSLHTSPSAN